MLKAFAPWSYLFVGAVALMIVGGAYVTGRMHGDAACVKTTQDHDDKIRREGEKIEAGKAQLREDSLRRIIINQDTAYRKQAAEGARVASELEGAKNKLNQQMKTFAERLRHVKKSDVCIIPADAIRLLNEGIAPFGSDAGPAPAASGVPPAP